MKLKNWLKRIFGDNQSIPIETLENAAKKLPYKWVKIFRGKEKDDAWLLRLLADNYIILSEDKKTVSIGPGPSVKPKTITK